MKNNIFDSEINLKKGSATYLLYGDKRVDLLSYAKLFCDKVYKINYDEEYKDIFNHYDVFYMGEDVLKIDDIRHIIKEANTTSYTGRKKIIIINNVNKIDKNNSNLLLKTIEEPVNNLYFILLSHSLNILATIKSRCIIYEIKPENYNVSAEVYKMLDGYEKLIKQYLENDYDVEYKLTYSNINEYIDKLYEIDEVYDKILLTKLVEFISKNKFELKRNSYIFSRINSKINGDIQKMNDIFYKILDIDKNISKETFEKLLKIKEELNSNINMNKMFIYFSIIYMEG